MLSRVLLSPRVTEVYALFCRMEGVSAGTVALGDDLALSLPDVPRSPLDLLLFSFHGQLLEQLGTDWLSREAYRAR